MEYFERRLITIIQYYRKHFYFLAELKGFQDILSDPYNWTNQAQYNDASIDVKHRLEFADPYVKKFIKLKISN